jgi:predicted transcriptional regulator
MNIEYVRLDDDLCGALNRMAEDEERTVSEVVNEVLREFLNRSAGSLRETAS